MDTFGYRFYKTDDNFHRDLRPLIPLLLACQGDVLVGEEDDSDKSLLLTTGPLDPASEADLLSRAKKHLAPGCPSAPPMNQRER